MSRTPLLADRLVHRAGARPRPQSAVAESLAGRPVRGQGGGGQGARRAGRAGLARLRGRRGRPTAGRAALSGTVAARGHELGCRRDGICRCRTTAGSRRPWWWRRATTAIDHGGRPSRRGGPTAETGADGGAARRDVDAAGGAAGSAVRARPRGCFGGVYGARVVLLVGPGTTAATRCSPARCWPGAGRRVDGRCCSDGPPARPLTGPGAPRAGRRRARSMPDDTGAARRTWRRGRRGGRRARCGGRVLGIGGRRAAGAARRGAGVRRRPADDRRGRPAERGRRRHRRGGRATAPPSGRRHRDVRDGSSRRWSRAPRPARPGRAGRHRARPVPARAAPAVLRLPTAATSRPRGRRRDRTIDKYTRGVVGVAPAVRRTPAPPCCARCGRRPGCRDGAVRRAAGRPTGLAPGRAGRTVAGAGRVQAWVVGAGSGHRPAPAGARSRGSALLCRGACHRGRRRTR